MATRTKGGLVPRMGSWQREPKVVSFPGWGHSNENQRWPRSQDGVMAMSSKGGLVPRPSPQLFFHSDKSWGEGLGTRLNQKGDT